MSESLFSQSWYRVADLKPQLRKHAQIHRHHYRGNVWFVLQDHSTGRFHRFTPEAYLIIGLMNGKRSIQEIWETACARLGDDMPTQDEVIHLLSQLHQSDVLQTDITPDIPDLQKRSSRVRRTQLAQQFRSPLAIRIPFLDPERFLNFMMPIVRPLFGTGGILLILVTVVCALAIAVMHWSELTTNITDKVLSLENLVLLGLIYPVVKAVHELGHAFFVKRWGGEVHEMGIMFLVFMPVPYVDASSSSAFRDKRKRMLVSAAGIMVESFLAAIAMFVWVSVEPGIFRALAYNVMLIAGVSTVLFNGNPLLRFDAYYILADFLEIPNLAMRANRYIGYLLQRYVFSIKDAESPVQEPGEAKWLALYSILSFLYRMTIMVTIALFVAGKFFFIGIILAVWSLFNMLVMPLIKIVGSVFKNPIMYRSRARIIWISSVYTGLLLVLLLFIPLPSSTVTEGVVRAPDHSHVRVGVNGFITGILATPGAKVQKGLPLVQMKDPDLSARVNILKAQLREAEARYQATVENRTGIQIIKEEINKIQSELVRAYERQNALIIKSPADGLFILPSAKDLPGMFAPRGTSIGYVVEYSDINVRTVVAQSVIDQVRLKTQRVEARLSENIGSILQASIIREVPAATKELPSVALSLEGGGQYALDPERQGEVQAFERLFQFDIDIEGIKIDKIGERVYIRFNHFPETLAARWYRGLRQLFLKKFDV